MPHWNCAKLLRIKQFTRRMTMSVQDLKTATTGKAVSPMATMQTFLTQHKRQFELALPKHLDADRIIRLALTSFSSSKKLQQCSPKSFAASVLTASQLGLEIGVVGQGFLVPYNTKKGMVCQFIPGWQGLVDLVSRSGRGTAWTGAVFEGDDFDFQLGDSPYVKHRPKGEDSPDKITYVYAIGRAKDADWPVIEVWPIEKVRRHRNKYNKVGDQHYSYENWEMYARKIPLLQVIKYMPKSIEVQNAIAATEAFDMGKTGSIIEGQFVTEDPEGDGDDNQQAERDTAAAARAQREPEKEQPKTNVNPATGETASLLDDVKRLCAIAVATKDIDTAWLKLDDARIILPEMLPDNRALAAIEIEAAEAALKARVKA
jgi:recombination protein RecT